MHRCNTRCELGTHYDLAYSMRPDFTADTFKIWLQETYDRAREWVTILAVREVLEFDEAAAWARQQRELRYTHGGVVMRGPIRGPGPLRCFGFYARVGNAEGGTQGLDGEDAPTRTEAA